VQRGLIREEHYIMEPVESRQTAACAENESRIAVSYISLSHMPHIYRGRDLQLSKKEIRYLRKYLKNIKDI